MEILQTQENVKRMQILDLINVIIHFSAGCFIGKYLLSLNDTWLAFNGPALGTLTIGELIWWRVRKIIMRKGHSDGRDS